MKMNKSKLDVMAVGAHPDDIELRCGGTLIQLTDMGYQVGGVDLTEGELSTRGSVAVRRSETKQASAILGLSCRLNMQLPDGNIALTKNNQLKLIRIIRKYRPDIIFAPYWKDRHPDHVHASELVEEAAFYSGLEKIKTRQQAFRPFQIVYYMNQVPFQPAFIVDISKTFKRKVQAIKAYETQFYNPQRFKPETFISRKSFMQFVKARDQLYGFNIDVAYGEPFYVKNPFKVTNLMEFLKGFSKI